MLLRFCVSIAGIFAVVLAYRICRGVPLPVLFASVVMVSSGTVTLGIAAVTVTAWLLGRYLAILYVGENLPHLVLSAGACAWATFAYFRGGLISGGLQGILPRSWLSKYGPRLRRGYGVLAAALAFALLVRGLPVVELSGGLYLAVLLAVALPPDPARRFALKSLVFNLLLLLVSVSFAYGIAELAVRRLTPVTKGSLCLVPDPQTYSTLAPNVSTTYYLDQESGPPRPFVIVTSSQGLRDKEWGPKAEGEFRILMIGDSFAMGWGLDFPDTIPQQLQRMLSSAGLRVPVTVINGGVGGFAPWQERIFLRNKGFPLHPDLVILQVFPDNDVPDSLALNEYLDSYAVWSARIRRVYRYCELFPYWCEGELREHSYVYRLLLRDLSGLPYVAEGLLSLRVFPPDLVPPLPPSLPRSFLIEASLRHMYPRLEKAYRHMEADIRGIQEDCEKDGVALLAFVLPNETSIVEARWNEATHQGAAPDDYIRFADVARTEDILTRNAIAFARVLEPLQEGQCQADMYINRDGHLTPRGAQVVADTLKRRVLEIHFPSSHAGNLKSGG